MKFFASQQTASFYEETPGVVMPDDATEISKELRDALLAEEAQGGIIVFSDDGIPVAIDPPPLTGDELIKRQIVVLESQQTPRRIREAALGIDNGWLAGIEAQIVVLRAQLGGE